MTKAQKPTRVVAELKYVSADYANAVLEQLLGRLTGKNKNSLLIVKQYISQLEAQPFFSKTAFKKRTGFRWRPQDWILVADTWQHMTKPLQFTERMLRNLIKPHVRQRRLEHRK